LRRRPEQGLLGGMLEVPSTPWAAGAPRAPLRSAPFAAAWRPLPGRVRHVFTHFALELEVRVAAAPAGAAGDGFWARPERFGALALPSLMRKLARHALRHVGGTAPERAAGRAALDRNRIERDRIPIIPFDD